MARPGDLPSLLVSSRRVKAAGRTAWVTFIATAGADIDLLPFMARKDLTGIDVDALLDSPDRPQWLSVELLWQQWAGDVVFRPFPVGIGAEKMDAVRALPVVGGA